MMVTPPPVISIVTPSFNQGNFIRATIESVLAQDYPALEYWIIDGGSNDQTLAIIQEYAHDPRLHWVSEPDRGQSDAINKGLARCTGSIFTWLNSDDVLLPGALQQVADAWQRHGPALFYGLARYIDADDNDLGLCPMQSANVSLTSLLRMRSTFMQPATFVPTQTVRNLDGVNENFHFGMDFDLWLRLVQYLPIRHIPAELALYRLHAESKTVALSAAFIADKRQALQAAAMRGQLSWHEALAYSDLFAARIFLIPGTVATSQALLALLRSVLLAPQILPDALRILGGALTRQLVGEERWAQVRALKARFE
ncbi:MAG: glycosyltransferase family 2 protein [Oscillochloridaceae bacterium umkhey_bin13]